MIAQSQVEERQSGATPLSRMLYARAIDKVYAGRAPPVAFRWGQKWDELYPFVGSTIGNRDVSYLEFGVFRGHSMRTMAEIFTDEQARFVGFDSFEGLPEAWKRKKKGAFSTEGNTPRIDDQRVSFVKGYFQDTVPDFMARQRLTAPFLVHFDADLYSSTLFLLTTLWHHIPEYYFIFDEFQPDEAIAMHDFAISYPIEFEYFACTAPNKDRNDPCQLFGRLKRVDFVL